MTRVALFGVAVAAVFALAFAGGRVLDVGPRTVAEAASHGEEDAMDGGGWSAFPAGLAVAMDGYRLVPERTALKAGASQDVVFRIVDDAGRTVRDFDVEHEKRLHLIVVRRDLETFLHVHPEQRADGAWVARLRLPSGGAYRAFADFTTGGARRTLGVDLFADGAATRVPAPRARYDAQLRRDGERLEFEVTRGGEPVRVEPYLGAGGHLVVLREGDLAYVHAHAEEDELAFEVPFPTAGAYRLFLQYQVDGSVETASFEVEA